MNEVRAHFKMEYDEYMLRHPELKAQEEEDEKRRARAERVAELADERAGAPTTALRALQRFVAGEESEDEDA